MDAVLGFLNSWKEVIAIVLFVIMAVNAQAKAAIAATSEIMQKSKDLTDETALELAATLLGKIAWLGWMPIAVRKFIVQTVFNAIKKLANKNA